ncbi:tRNA (adenosine(37)-N6)-dimethylallyltransferase MiaA, partial [Streptomyces sp. TRM76130]|nr:tRNA (adenosine(37)-N6)-dimethylallyltransferase MiaA [Streptomyces sp. TRM76130]
EVIELTGRPFTANLPGHDSVYDTVQIGVDVARPELDARIARRVDRMWEAGLVDEVRALEAQGLREGRTASR